MGKIMAALPNLSGVLLTPLKRIHTCKGDVLHGLKASDASFDGFGEAYFSEVLQGSIKGWKLHKKMTTNLIVPVGEVRFYVCSMEKEPVFWTTVLSAESYSRLTIRPNHWFAFEGISSTLNLVLNIANIEHDPEEAATLGLNELSNPWFLSE